MWTIFHLLLKRGKYTYYLRDEREKKLTNQRIKTEFWMWGSREIERKDVVGKLQIIFKPSYQVRSIRKIDDSDFREENQGLVMILTAMVEIVFQL